MKKTNHMNWIAYFLIILGTMKSFTQETDAHIKKILWTASWSNDSKFIAIGGNDKKIKIYNGKTFEFIKNYDLKEEIKKLKWHPTKNLLAIAAEGNQSKIINVETNKVTTFKDIKHNGSRAIAWNYNGNLIALGDYEGKLHIINNNGNLVKTIKRKGQKTFIAIDWHPHKNEFIILSEFVRVYNEKGEELKFFKHRKEVVLMLSVKWHKSGKFFVIGDYGNDFVPHASLLQFWNANYTLKKQNDKSKAEIRNISWNKKGNRLATASDALRIWNKKGNLLKTSLSSDYLWGIDWSPNGKYIVTSSIGGKIKIWSKKGKLLKNLNY